MYGLYKEAIMSVMYGLYKEAIMRLLGMDCTRRPL